MKELNGTPETIIPLTKPLFSGNHSQPQFNGTRNNIPVPKADIPALKIKNEVNDSAKEESIIPELIIRPPTRINF